MNSKNVKSKICQIFYYQKYFLHYNKIYNGSSESYYR